MQLFRPVLSMEAAQAQQRWLERHLRKRATTASGFDGGGGGGSRPVAAGFADDGEEDWLVNHDDDHAPANGSRGHGGRPRSRKPVMPRKNGIFWGGVWLPRHLAQYNFLLAGCVGSGKTINLRLFMQSILPYIGSGKGMKAVINDPKRDMLPIIRGINPTCPIYNMNPMSENHTAWEMCHDILSPANAESMATTLAPDQNAVPGKDDFWRLAFTFMLHGLTLYFIKHAKNDQGVPQWRLRDLILGTRSIERLQKILGSDSETQRFLAPLSGDRLTLSIHVTILVYLNQFAVVASLWEQAARRITLHEFDKPETEGILVLGRDVENMATLAPINRLLLTRLGQIQLNRPEDRPRAFPSDCFYILDEFHNLGFLSEFEEVATTGRSKGLSLAIAFQSIASLIRIYGNEAAQAIAGPFLHRGFLRLNDSWTAQWASDLHGYGERFRQEYQNGWLVETEDLEMLPIVPASDFAKIELPDEEEGQGVTGFYTAGNFSYWYTMPSRFISRHLQAKDKLIGDYRRLSAAYQHLKPWDLDDLRRLNLDRVISPDEHQAYLREEERLMRRVKDAGKGLDSIQDMLAKLGMDYNPNAATGDAEEDVWTDSDDEDDLQGLMDMEEFSEDTTAIKARLRTLGLESDPDLGMDGLDGGVEEDRL